MAGFNEKILWRNLKEIKEILENFNHTAKKLHLRHCLGFTSRNSVLYYALVSSSTTSFSANLYLSDRRSSCCLLLDNLRITIMSRMVLAELHNDLLGIH